MAAIIIRRLSDDVHKALKARAKANGRSAEAEARLSLERLFGELKPRSRSAWDVIQSIKDAYGGGFDMPDVARSQDPVEALDIE